MKTLDSFAPASKKTFKKVLYRETMNSAPEFLDVETQETSSNIVDITESETNSLKYRNQGDCELEKSKDKADKMMQKYLETLDESSTFKEVAESMFDFEKTNLSFDPEWALAQLGESYTGQLVQGTRTEYSYQGNNGSRLDIILGEGIINVRLINEKNESHYSATLKINEDIQLYFDQNEESKFDLKEFFKDGKVSSLNGFKDSEDLEDPSLGFHETSISITGPEYDPISTVYANAEGRVIARKYTGNLRSADWAPDGYQPEIIYSDTDGDGDMDNFETTLLYDDNDKAIKGTSSRGRKNLKDGKKLGLKKEAFGRLNNWLDK